MTELYNRVGSSTLHPDPETKTMVAQITWKLIVPEGEPGSFCRRAFSAVCLIRPVGALPVPVADETVVDAEAVVGARKVLLLVAFGR